MFARITQRNRVEPTSVLLVIPLDAGCHLVAIREQAHLKFDAGPASAIGWFARSQYSLCTSLLGLTR
jgi:hypothetical protein